MARESVVAVFATREQARIALEALDRVGFPLNQVSFVRPHVTDEVPQTQELQYGDNTERNAAAGAGMGGLLGLMASTPILMVAGIGPMVIAGPLGLGLAGAVVGGFLGAMSGWGVHEDHIQQYEKLVSSGNSLVVLEGDPEQ
ncbi:MAG: hypothetical protein AB7F89_10160, partial [Pirellulaceae bacterium]